MEEDKKVNVGTMCAFLMGKVSELYAVTDLLYEKLKENNIDMSDFQERFDVKREVETKKILKDFTDFNNKDL